MSSPQKNRQPQTAALYARVSTALQTPQNQLAELRAYCDRAGLQIVAEYVDHGCTGASIDRPELRSLLQAASRREFDQVVFWSLDRLTRSGILDTLNTLKELAGYGVSYHSYTEPHVSSAGPLSELWVAVVSTFAKIEREANAERTRAGLDRARKAGQQLGRPRRIVSADRLIELRAEGMSFAQIARKTGVSRKTVARRLATI